MSYAVIKWRVEVRTEIVVSVIRGVISEEELKNWCTKNYYFSKLSL